MKTFPKDIQFVYQWRSYQRRALEEMERHFEDKHFHLVAPPGSGKTVLGIEILLRLNKPTLILAPTTTIKNQWRDRFVELFLNSDEAPEWLSMDLRDPGFLTITTYQALHSLSNEKVDETTQDEVGAGVESVLEQSGFQTLVLDEAHHLRTAWWKSTVRFRNSLDQPSVVALTATPPYDVSQAEWERYIELCGPVDDEISVPELVRQQDLCPHQDYIYFSKPSSKEKKTIQTFQDNTRLVYESLLDDQEFIRILENHPFVGQPDQHVEELLSDAAYTSSILIFLKQAGSPLWGEIASVLSGNEKEVPELTMEWLEELLTGCIYKDPHTKDREKIKEIKKWLNRIGAVKRRKVHLRSTREIDRLLMNSVSKLNSIGEIVQFESNQLKEKLRLVVLTDYIRLSALPKNKDDLKPVTQLGVIPVFEQLRRKNDKRLKLGVLSGSIAIIPRSAVPMLESHLDADESDIYFTPLAHDEDYVSVHMNSSDNQQIVRVMTDMFKEGGIQVLVGTTALLGEGWDAPSINSLILASYVGTFMLSNQMRGRAIRVQRENENKTSNIWHLVCVDHNQTEQGHDMATLERRFQSFVGVSLNGNQIESGIGRMNPESSPFLKQKVGRLNENMFSLAEKRENLKAHWDEAIETGEGHMIRRLKTSPKGLPRKWVFKNTVRALLWQALMIALTIFSDILDGLNNAGPMPMDTIFTIVIIGAVLGFLLALPKTIKAVWLLVRHGTVEKSVRQVGVAVFITLRHMGLIQTEVGQKQIQAFQDPDGLVHCQLNGGTTYEQTLFLDALQEILDPIQNPRYLILRKSSWGFIKRFDYHAVPELIGRNKKTAEFFLKQWRKRLGTAELVFTRRTSGRQKLVNARLKSMSSAFVKRSDRLNAWQ